MSSADQNDKHGNQKIKCLECKGNWYHRLDVHLQSRHDLTAAQYDKLHPGAPVISEWAENKDAKKKQKAKPIKRALEGVKAAIEKPAPANGLKFGCATLYQRTNISKADQAFIPEHDEKWCPGKNELDTWEACALGIESNEPVLITGPTGCGKSTGVLELACVIDQPVRRVNLHGDVRTSDFVGHMAVTVDEESGQAVTEWVDGILTQAMRAGHWLLLDELDASPPQILFVLQAVLERNGKLVLGGNHGEVVRPHKNFRIIATANTLGRGDESGLYAGTNVLNEAFLDRFGVVIATSYADQATEISILCEKTEISKDVAGKMVKIAMKIREAASKEECYATFSTRRLITWAEKTVKMGGAQRAAPISVLNRLGTDDREFVRGVIQRYFVGDA